MKFQNDTGAALIVVTRVDLNNANLRPTNRKVDLIGPFFANQRPHPADKYVLDPRLAPGQVEQTDWAHDGADVTLRRAVTMPDGQVHTDTFLSHYLPWQAVYHVGPSAATDSTSSSPDAGGASAGSSTPSSSV